MRAVIRYSITALLVVAICALLDYRYPPQPLQVDYSTRVYDRHGELLWRFASASDGALRYQREANQIPAHYKDALLAFEDRWFYYHPGVNPLSLLRASWQYLRYGRIISGGSTITMQLVRMQHRLPRTFKGKLQQMARALQYEWHYSKTDILNAYIDRVPMGGAIEGVEAAARHYFATPASALTLSQSLVLAGIPQNPEQLRPDRYPQQALLQRNKLLGRYSAIRRLEPADINRIAGQSIVIQSEPVAQTGYWTAQALRSRYPDRHQLHSTLDLIWQQNLQALTNRHHYQRGEAAAIIVLDNHTGEIRVRAGNHWQATEPLWLDLSNVVRSPGSTLKPFLYAQALTQKLVHSESLLVDVPQSFQGYRPGNFNRRFHGAVSVSEALQHSLNVPAVALLNRIGVDEFADLLTTAGLHRSRASPNLSLVLGGTGTTLVDLVGAYRALAKEGQRVAASDDALQVPTSHPWLDPTAAWIVANTLSELTPPSGYRSRRKVAWKTGTSWGGRDAWAIGVSADYTVGVWLGSVDGTGNGNRSGYHGAGELLFAGFDLLPPDRSQWQQPKPAIKQPICWPIGRHSQYVAAADCQQRRLAWTIDGITPATLGTAAGQWPDQLLQWQRDKRLTDAWQGTPKINSLQDGQYIATPQYPVTLQAAAQGALDWYLDGALLPDGILQPGLSQGPHQLTVVDTRGRFSEIQFFVR